MKYAKHEAKEASREFFHGVWTALTTPFHPDGSLDEEGLRRNMRYLCEELSIDGVFCTGTMAECWALTLDEWKRSIEIVVDEANGKCGVIAHTGHHSASITVELTLHAQEVGADFAIIMNPIYPSATDQGRFEWFEWVCDKVDIGVWLFEGSYVGYAMPPELIARIAEIPNVCGLKEAWPIDHYADVKTACGEKIVISQPNESRFLHLMREYGMQVHMSSPTPYQFQRPGWTPIRDYYHLEKDGNSERADQVSAQLEALRKLDQKWVAGRLEADGIMPNAYLKAWSEMLGMAGGPVRAPLEQITPEEREELKADLEAVGLLTSDLSQASALQGHR